MTQEEADQLQVELILRLALSEGASGDKLTLAAVQAAIESSQISPDLRWPPGRLSNHLGHGQAARYLILGNQEISQATFKETLKKFSLTQGTSEHLAKFVSLTKAWVTKERHASTIEHLATRIQPGGEGAHEEDTAKSSRTNKDHPGEGAQAQETNVFERGMALVQAAVDREVKTLRADHEVHVQRLLKLHQDHLHDVRSASGSAIEEVRLTYKQALASKDQSIGILERSLSTQKVITTCLGLLTLGAIGLSVYVLLQGQRPAREGGSHSEIPNNAQNQAPSGLQPSPTISSSPVMGHGSGVTATVAAPGQSAPQDHRPTGVTESQAPTVVTPPKEGAPHPPTLEDPQRSTAP